MEGITQINLFAHAHGIFEREVGITVKGIEKIQFF